VGVFSAGKRRVWLDGETEMRYLCDLRIHPHWQGSSLLARGFRRLRREVFQPGEWAQTLVLDDNARALETLTSQRGRLPEYHPAGRYASWLLPAQRINGDSGIKVRQATDADLHDMQNLLDDSARRRSFSAMVNLSDLGKPAFRDLSLGNFLIAERNGRLLGMMGLWDQSGYQRLKVHGYPPLVSATRPLWNVAAGIMGGVPLPRTGGVLPLRKATAIACVNDDPIILRAMLASALAGHERRLLLLGMSAVDPLVHGLHRLKARKQYGMHYLVGWEGEPPKWDEPFAFDVARI
jgi:hypothetical protein